MLKEITINGDPFDYSQYPESGFFLNTASNDVYAVNKNTFYVAWIGNHSAVAGIFEENKSNQSGISEEYKSNQSGISEEYSLKLVQTIIRELK